MQSLIWHVGSIDPVAIDLGIVQVRWYALAYIAGLLSSLKLSIYLAKSQNLNFSEEFLDNFFTWAVLGVLLGGRLGYVMFYKPEFYLSNPMEILMVNKGGMSFHGAFIGVTLACYVYSKKHAMDMLRFSDLFVVTIPIGIFFGRMANFVNGELWGRVTDGTWGVVFPYGGDQPRHPSQLYEAFFEGIVLFVFLYILATRFNGFKVKGLNTGVFIMGYGLSRIFVEGFREPDAFIGMLVHSTTFGQWLSLPMVIIGASLIRHGVRKYG